jgi:hypothetical protein
MTRNICWMNSKIDMLPRRGKNCEGDVVATNMLALWAKDADYITTLLYATSHSFEYVSFPQTTTLEH